MITIAWLLLIYITAIFFWFRYLYKRSLKTTEDRFYFLDSLNKIFLFVPLGFQGILLFHFAVIHTIPLSIKFAGLFEFLFFRHSESALPYFEAAKIIFAGALLLAVQHLLLTMDIPNHTINFLFKVAVFIAGIFFLKVLAENIFHSLSFSFSGAPTISYDNNYLWLLSAVVFLVILIINVTLKNKTEMKPVKNLGLASIVVWLYSLLIFIIALPQIIFIVIEHFQHE